MVDGGDLIVVGSGVSNIAKEKYEGKEKGGFVMIDTLGGKK